MHWLCALAMLSSFNNVVSEQFFMSRLVCHHTHMQVFVDYMDGRFSGVIYTEGSYDNADCFREVTNMDKIVFDVPYDRCKTKNSNEMYTNTVIIQHHRIMTADDAAFKISCDKRNLLSGMEITLSEAIYTDYRKHRFNSVFDPDQNAKVKYFPSNKRQKTIETDRGTTVYVLNQKNDSKQI